MKIYSQWILLFFSELNLVQPNISQISLFIEDTSQSFTITWSSSSAAKSITWLLPDLVSKYTNFTSKNDTFARNDGTFYTQASIIIKGIDSRDFSGDYSIVVDTGSESKTVIVGTLKVLGKLLLQEPVTDL